MTVPTALFQSVNAIAGDGGGRGAGVAGWCLLAPARCRASGFYPPRMATRLPSCQRKPRCMRINVPLTEKCLRFAVAGHPVAMAQITSPQFKFAAGRTDRYLYVGKRPRGR